MTPYSLLTGFDADVIDNYICRATGRFREADLKDVLAFWSKAKQRLLDEVFYTDLRVTTHVHVDTSDSYSDKKAMVSKACVGLVSSFADCAYAHAYNDRTDSDSINAAMGVFSPHAITLDQEVGDTVIYFDGEPHLFRGKRMRVIRKVLELFEFEDMKVFEEFRDRVSLIRTVQDFDADVTLSINPIDYLSMSDNSCGWSSCMSMASKKGTCREGVLEYLNSETAIVAYVKSKNSYLPGVPNKTWRQMVFCDLDHECVMGSRQYPYECEGLAKAAIKCIAKRAGLGYDEVFEYPHSEYEKSIVCSCDNYDVKNKTKAYYSVLGQAGGDNNIDVHDSIIPWSLGACNDFFMFKDDDKFYRTGLYVDYGCEELAMSGKPTCLLCGHELSEDRYGTNKITCENCEKGVHSAE